MATVTTVIAVVTSILVAVLAGLNIRDKVWPRPSSAHPLDPALARIDAELREIARAIRRSKGLDEGGLPNG